MATTAQHFGHVVKLWFRFNDWPQGITQNWSKALPEGVAPHGPWASQVCQSIKGEHDPKTGFWLGWGQFNHAVFTGKFAPITDRRLIDQLSESRALTKEDGEPWLASDFFALFVGELEEPAWLMEMSRVMQPEDIEHWVRGLRSDFHKLCMNQCISRPDGWALVANKLEDYTPGDLQLAKEITIGFREADLATATRLNMKDEKLPRLSDVLQKLANEQMMQEPVLSA